MYLKHVKTLPNTMQKLWTVVEWKSIPLPVSDIWNFMSTDNNQLLLSSVGSAYTSPDGQDWKQNSIMPNLTSAAWGGSLYCAVGSDGKGATSYDGMNWTQQVLPSASNTNPQDTAYNSVQSNSSVFCAISNSKTISSPDGRHWEQNTLPTTDDYSNLVTNGKTFCAVSKTRPVYITSDDDGETFVEHPLPALASGNHYIAASPANPTFIFLTKSTTVTSPDLITWEQRTLPATNQNLSGITYNGHKFCIIGDGSISMISPDGIHWTTKPIMTGYKNVAFNKNGFYVLKNYTPNMLFYPDNTDGPPLWVTSGLSPGITGTSYNDKFVAKYATNYSIFNGKLINGLTYNSSSGEITGTVDVPPLTIGTNNFIARATNAFGSDIRVFSMSYGPPPFPVTNQILSSGRPNHHYQQQLRTTEIINDPIVYKHSALPKGLTMDNTGKISGTIDPSVPPGPHTFNVTMTNHTTTTQKQYTMYTYSYADSTFPPAWNIDPILPLCVVGYNYSTAVYADNATNPSDSSISYNIISGSLPPGLTFSTTTSNGSFYGVISGITTDTTNYTSSFTIRAINSYGNADLEFSIDYGAEPIVYTTSTTLPSVSHGESYDCTIHANNAFKFIVSGSLPNGLSMTPGGHITGVVRPDAVTTSFTITASNPVTTAGENFTLPIIPSTIPPVWITDEEFPISLIGVGYKFSLLAIYADTYELIDGTLPTGFSISYYAGIVGGTNNQTPTIGDVMYFTIRAANSGHHTDKTFKIRYASIPVFFTTSLFPAIAHQSYQQSVQADFAYRYALDDGKLPNGLSMDSQGNITGIPAANAVSSLFTVSAINDLVSTSEQFFIPIAFNMSSGLGSPIYVDFELGDDTNTGLDINNPVKSIKVATQNITHLGTINVIKKYYNISGTYNARPDDRLAWDGVNTYSKEFTIDFNNSFLDVYFKSEILFAMLGANDVRVTVQNMYIYMNSTSISKIFENGAWNNVNLGNGGVGSGYCASPRCVLIVKNSYINGTFDYITYINCSSGHTYVDHCRLSNITTWVNHGSCVITYQNTDVEDKSTMYNNWRNI